MIQRIKEMNPDSKRKLKKWSITTFAVITAGFAILSLVLALIPVRFGVGLDWDNVRRVEVGNLTGGGGAFDTDEAWLATRPQHEFVINEVTRLLTSAQRTNALAQTFRRSNERVLGMGGAPTVNGANMSQAGIIRNSTDFVRVVFCNDNPQFALHNRGGGNYDLIDADDERATAATMVRAIFIPFASDISNRFGEHNIFFTVNNANHEPIRHRMVTYGNFYRLASFVRDLRMPLVPPSDAPGETA